jgi:hypothetical protein
MNNQRRQKIRKAIKKIEKIKDRLEEITEDIDAIKMDEECMFDNLPDWKQTSDHGVASEEAARDMQEAMDEIEYADTNLETSMDRLKEVAE